ncbi:hypothetical protein CY0110_17252 [Crocosphaera chwakensis CCY0110]|uniref:Uncharacterized protein n=1 Tax=Crocosphaera chwakensis CCY0110 TaxID=391612 RepID=A3IID2_9CHRO|nr:hypothetical protein CY0110_17252 [Crocosphaera chwakensis CCY0110]
MQTKCYQLSGLNKKTIIVKLKE